jgi:GTP-binding protein
MAEFLERRQALAGLVIVMDVRHPLAEYDRRMLAWGLGAGLSVLLLLTKSDKLKRGPVRATQLSVEREARRLAGADGRVRVEAFSARDYTGVEPVQALLDSWLEVPPRA